MTDVDSGPLLKTFATGLGLLEDIAEHGPCTLRVLCAGRNLNYQAAYRAVATLVSCGFVRRNDADNTYELTTKCWSLGATALNKSGLRNRLSIAVRNTAEESGETAQLVVYDDGEAVYIEKAEGKLAPLSYAHIGSRAPAYATANGKVVLAYQTPREIDRVATGVLERFTPYTKGSKSALLQELTDIRARDGVGHNRGEWREEIGGVAVAFTDPLSNQVFGLGLAGPLARIQEHEEELVQILLKARQKYGTER